MRALQIDQEITAFTSAVEAPGIGALPINAFLIRGEQPILIDAGITPEHDPFVAAIRELIDPRDLRWIVLTHADRDHTGALSTMLREAPDARVLTHFITLGMMGTSAEPVPPERAHLVRHESTVDAGDRTLTFLRPPLFDNPGTLAVFDSKQRTLFSSDCFGAALPDIDAALSEDVGTVAADALKAGQLLWGSVDAPWAHLVEPSRLREGFGTFLSMHPDMVLSTHLPPIRRDLARHVDVLSSLPGAAPFIAPDQAAVEAMMAQIAH